MSIFIHYVFIIPLVGYGLAGIAEVELQVLDVNVVGLDKILVQN